MQLFGEWVHPMYRGVEAPMMRFPARMHERANRLLQKGGTTFATEY
jgi:hypothetical protein